MFDEMIIHDGTVKNITDESGAVAGFSFDTHIPYYRGLGLSMIEVPEVVVDGQAVDPENMRFVYQGVRRTFAELADVTDVRWELRTFATIEILQPGGLSAGEHTISVNLRLRVSYLPMLSENRYTRTVTLAA